MIWLSVPLGLLAWFLPLAAKNWDLPHKSRFAYASFVACVLALVNVLWEFYRRIQSGDLNALLDITDALTACSVILVLGTAAFNLWLLRRPKEGRTPTFRWEPTDFQQLLFVLVLAAVSFVTLIVIMLVYQESGVTWKPANEGVVNFLRGHALAIAHGITLAGLAFYLKHIPLETVHWTLPLGFALSPLCIWLDLLLSEAVVALRHLLGDPISGPYEWGDAEADHWVLYSIPWTLLALLFTMTAKGMLRTKKTDREGGSS